MRALSIGVLLISSIATAAPVVAKGPPQDPSPAVNSSLHRALDLMVQSTQSADRDQGDEHASARAIQVVCSKGTPAASHSAICPPVSPE